MDEIPVTETAKYEVTCRTFGCGNENINILVDADVNTPSVVCGPCGQPITNITPV